MNTLLLSSARLLLALTLLCGVVYPATVTALAQVAFPSQAEGSRIERSGRVVGSALVGQAFARPEYVWSRPSATAKPYDGAASSGSNLGPSNPALYDAVAGRVAALAAAHPGAGPVPHELVTTSASGLDPHLSPAAARWQAGRVAAARGVSADAVEAVIARHVEGPWAGVFGASRVNVLQLNLDLDASFPVASAP